MESAATVLPATPAPYPKSVRWEGFRKTVPETSPSLSPLSPTTFERGTSCASGNFQRGTSSGLETHRSFGCEVEVRSYGPIHDRMKRRMYLQSFVRANGFKSLHTARSRGGCWLKGESLYPIHVAVMSGDLELVQMMLNEGVDPEKESSRGRNALDFAKKANVCGSHVEIIKLLEATM